MPSRKLNEDDPLDDFEHRQIVLDGVNKVVHVAGRGPAVIVMTEMPGISPHVARFARWVRDAGFTVYMPSLFGRDGAVPDAEEGAAIFQRACVSAEFRALASNESSPVTKWLRSLARVTHGECGEYRSRTVLGASRHDPAQRCHRAPDRRGRPADDRGPRRDFGVLQAKTQMSPERTLLVLR